MAPRLSGQTSVFGVVFFVSKSLLGIERQKKHEKSAILTRTPRSHARILIYRMWQLARTRFSALCGSAADDFEFWLVNWIGCGLFDSPESYLLCLQ